MARRRFCPWLSPPPSPGSLLLRPPPPPALAVFWKLVKRFMSSLPEFLPLLRCLSGEMGNEKEQMLGCSVLIGVQTTVGVRMRLGWGQPVETPKHKPEGGWSPHPISTPELALAPVMIPTRKGRRPKGLLPRSKRGRPWGRKGHGIPPAP